MSEMDFKKSTDLDFPRYAAPAVSAKEIDLLGLFELLLAAKKTYRHHYLCFRAGGADPFIFTAGKMDQ